MAKTRTRWTWVGDELMKVTAEVREIDLPERLDWRFYRKRERLDDIDLWLMGCFGV